MEQNQRDRTMDFLFKPPAMCLAERTQHAPFLLNKGWEREDVGRWKMNSLVIDDARSIYFLNEIEGDEDGALFEQLIHLKKWEIHQ